jgi:hypothetical protein
MRKFYLATSALVAALAFAGAASAQNAHVQGLNQVNSADQRARLDISNVTVGRALTASGASVGNIVSIDARDPSIQGIAELNVGSGLGTGPQSNTGDQFSTVRVADTDVARNADLSSTAAANVVNLEGNLVTQRANATFSQFNSGDARARLNIVRSDFDRDLTGVSAAIGNSLSAEGDTVLLTPGVGNAATQANYIPTDVLGQRQDNSGTQFATLRVRNVDAGSVDLTAQGVGNGVSIDADVTANVGGHQNNTGLQVAYLEARRLDAGDTDLNSVAIGNTIAAEGPLVTVTGTPSGFGIGDSSIRQFNSGIQVGATSVVNSDLGDANVTGAAVGNVLSFEGGTLVIGGSNSQVNTGLQLAVASVDNTDFNGTADIASQSVGNLLPITQTGSMSIGGFQQSNTGFQMAFTGVNGSSFDGAANIGSTAAGNVLSVEAPGGVYMGGVNQSNTFGQLSLTSISGSNFGNLTAGATSVGNSVSIKIK